MNIKKHLSTIKFIFLTSMGFLLILTTNISAAEFPAAGWHRGDVSSAQENSRNAIIKALNSSSPNIEVDIMDFFDSFGKRTGILAHDYNMERIAGSKGNFIDNHDISTLPNNSANSELSPEPYLTVIELFDIIKQSKERGSTPFVSLDMKEEGDTGEAFGVWIGNLIKEYNFQDHVFASSFFKNNVVGVEKSCSECLTGGLVFNDHWALKNLDYHHTSLDITTLGKMTFFMGFLGKEEFPHDFVLIQDDIIFEHPEITDYWRNERKVKFVGVFVYQTERPYTEKEWGILENIDWIELDPPQMDQYIQNKKTNKSK
ncbi:MAG: hypothetical protein HOD17_12970 [Desulfobacteraceae bacterium]|jgi:hypothetical protein|nr:hypothetical protein [Desulfobacteraceae bacterium]